MYIEFVIIYIGLVVIAAMLGVVIYLLVKNSKGSKNERISANMYYSNNVPGYTNQGCDINQQQYGNVGYSSGQQYTYGANAQQYGSNNGIIVCKNCGTQFDSSRRACPKCGTPR